MYSDNGAGELFVALETNTTLKMLNIRQMRGILSKNALEKLAVMLSTNQSLTELHVSEEDIFGDSSERYLRRFPPKNGETCRGQYEAIGRALKEWPTALLKLEGMHLLDLDAEMKADWEDFQPSAIVLCKIRLIHDKMTAFLLGSLERLG